MYNRGGIKSKYKLKPEEVLQINVVNEFSRQYPDKVVHHSPNEGKRTPREQALIKMMGVSAGFLDLTFFESSFDGMYKGLAIELKCGRNKPTPEQEKWAKHLSENGWKVYFIWDDPVKVLDVITIYFNKNHFVAGLNTSITRITGTGKKMDYIDQLRALRNNDKGGKQ